MRLFHEIADLATALDRLLFPRACHFCGCPLPDTVAFPLCASCRESVEEVPEPFCRTCGLPMRTLTGPHTSEVCGKCLGTPPPYRCARFAVYYNNGLRDALLRFKYAKQTHLAVPLSEYLIRGFRKYFDARQLDLIVPVPMHRKRLRQRGFNQALLLALRLSKATGIPAARDLLIKVRDTPAQVRSSALQRARNLKGSFRLADKADIRKSRILLVDDVLTTGATIDEASRTLMKAGARSVRVVVLALRTLNSSTPVVPSLDSPPGDLK